MSAPITLSLPRRDAELIVLALQEHATHTMGDPSGRANSARLAKALLALLDTSEVG